MQVPRKSIEDNLAQIAFATVSDVSPELMSYYLGFDLVERNDEGTRAAGIMGFKVGKSLMYVPIFFMNGKVKGTDVIYLKDKDIFVCNTEQWVTYLIGQAQDEYGESKDGPNESDAGETAKSLRAYSKSPESSKVASDDGWGFATIDDMIDVEKLNKKIPLTLERFVKKANAAYSDIASTFAREDVWKNLVSVYTPDEVRGMLGSPKQEQKKAQELNVEEKPHGLRLYLLESGDLEKNASDLSTEEKETLYSKGYLIKGAKEGDDACKVLIDENRRFEKINGSGMHKVLMLDGSLKKLLVLNKVIEPTRSDALSYASPFDGNTYIIDVSNGKFRRLSVGDELYGQHGVGFSSMSKDSKDDAFEYGKVISRAEVGSTYMALGKDGTAYGPFKVKNKKRANGVTSIEVDSGDDVNYFGSGMVGSVAQVSGGGKAAVMDDTLFLTEDYRLFRIDVNEDAFSSYRGTLELSPGGFATVMDAVLKKGGKKATIQKSGSDIHISRREGNKNFRSRADLVHFLCDSYDASVESSEKIATAVESSGTRPLSVAFVSKTADLNTQLGAARDGTPQEGPASETSRVMESGPPPAPATDMQFGSWNMADPEDLALLERAADASAREVFDPAMIGIITRTTRSQSMVQEYIPEFVDNLDRMIRLLLLFYWHNDEFASNYGIDEMADFEDLLLSAIKSTGKTILFLKQKAVKSSGGSIDALG